MGVLSGWSYGEFRILNHRWANILLNDAVHFLRFLGGLGPGFTVALTLRPREISTSVQRQSVRRPPIGIATVGRINNPFQQDAIILCSYQFARIREPYVRQTAWDLAVMDEAHRLRDVYKNTSKIASATKQAVTAFPKVPLTATPLQNTLLGL
jgi:hypothetical protein